MSMNISALSSGAIRALEEYLEAREALAEAEGREKEARDVLREFFPVGAEFPEESFLFWSVSEVFKISDTGLFERKAPKECKKVGMNAEGIRAFRILKKTLPPGIETGERVSLLIRGRKPMGEVLETFRRAAKKKGGKHGR